MANQDQVMKAPSLKRPEVEYTIPEALRVFDGDPVKVTVRPITIKEELDANAVATANGSGAAGLMVEIVRRAVASLNGKPIDWSSTDPQWFEAASPKVRDLITEAVMKWNRVSSKESADFFGSEKLVSGS